MKEVNAELYEFLQENETGFFKSEEEVRLYVHVYFFDLKDFVKIIGTSWFDEGGMDVTMFDNSICVDLNEIIEAEGHCISSYKNCFDESEWKQWEDEILEMEND